jgi:hypothetical protein
MAAGTYPIKIGIPALIASCASLVIYFGLPFKQIPILKYCPFDIVAT